MGHQILPVDGEVSVFKKTSKNKGVKKKGFREIKNLVCSINYEGRSASGDARVFKCHQ